MGSRGARGTRELSDRQPVTVTARRGDVHSEARPHFDECGGRPGLAWLASDGGTTGGVGFSDRGVLVVLVEADKVTTVFGSCPQLCRHS